MNFLMSRRSLFAAGLKLRASARKSLSYSNTYLGNMFSYIKAGLELRYTFIVLLFLVMAMYATKLCTENLKGLASLTGFEMMLGLGAWNCKPFLYPWRYNYLRLCEVDLMNTLYGPAKEEHSMHGSASDFLLLLSNICELGNKVLWFTVNLIATWDYLYYVIREVKYTFVSLLSFGVIFILTSYLVVLTLKLNRKRMRCRVNSCV